ncbi:MAG TPA: alpha/beta hydrolase [Thermoanaerobaculia bacterium]|nr:alpha/beta hydrolase [Thermoanaerobaculia bacterium]
MRRAGRRRGWKPLLALAGLGVAAAAAVVLTRRGRTGMAAPGAEPGAPGVEPAAADPAEALAPPPSPSALRESWIAGPAGTLFLREVDGPGLPVVLVHGLAGSGRLWGAQLAWLAGRHHAVALDLRGHGRSDPSVGGEYDVADYAADLAAAADALALRRFLLVGHSLGAAAAVEYAAHHRARVAGLLLVDPPGDSTRLPRGRVEELVATVARDPQGEVEFHYRQLLLGSTPETAQAVLDELAATGGEVLAPSLEAVMGWEPLAPLRRYQGPRLCLLSLLNDAPESLARLAPELPARTVREGSHWLMLDRPQAVHQALSRLLDQAAGAGPG